MQSRATDGDAERIRGLDGGWAAAAARRDLDGMMAIYAPDAQELLPGCPAIVGREAIRQFYAGLIQQFPQFAHHFESEAITVAQSGDLAVVRGSHRFTADTLQPAQAQECLERRPSGAVTLPLGSVRLGRDDPGGSSITHRVNYRAPRRSRAKRSTRQRRRRSGPVGHRP